MDIVNGCHGHPGDVLGPHHRRTGNTAVHAVRTFRPQEARVWVVDHRTGATREARCLKRSGFFECVWEEPSDGSPEYSLRLLGRDGQTYTIEDPYRFPALLTDYDIHLWNEGRFWMSWRTLGAHRREVDGTDGILFAVWAPNARRVSVVGPFNGWDERVHPMQLRQGGVWELFLPQLEHGERYKFSLLSHQEAYRIDKMDPFAFHSELRPDTASRVWSSAPFAWRDEAWMAQRAARQGRDSPLHIYEVHLGSWKRTASDNGLLSYRALAAQLVAHCQRMGYTHIELLPIMEHPLDRSWGYQVTGYFAPTSRFGDPDEFRAFVDICHRGGIGVLLDWVPGHFPKDGHGLAFFDGTHLYEHEDPRQGEHHEWETRVFNFGRHQVSNFLISNALFWLEEFHIDGFRVDAVASMLHLNYNREEGAWIPNRYGGHENIEAIEFLREFNRVVHTHHPGVITIAEESTSWPLVTYPDYVGGLGFDFKWNMGWMHDTLDYFKLDPVFRKFNQNLITFGLTYAHTENFVLAFSHDEVVHLKKSQWGKMPGDAWQRMANLRLLALYQFGHPGKKLNFMGNEFAQPGEWNEAQSLDWHVLDWPLHGQFRDFMAALGHLYLALPALWQRDSDPSGFAWIEFRDVDNTTVSFVRYGEEGEDTLVVILNMTPVPRYDYRIGVPHPGPWHELLNSDAEEFGGSGVINAKPIQTEPQTWHGFSQVLALTLPPLGGLLLGCRPRDAARQTEV